VAEEEAKKPLSNLSLYISSSSSDSSSLPREYQLSTTFRYCEKDVGYLITSDGQWIINVGRGA
jgi:hypothetical protein